MFSSSKFDKTEMKKSVKSSEKLLDEFSPNVEENLFDYSDNPTENIDLNYNIRSPLRYPGGKARGVEFIIQSSPKKS